MKNLTKFLALGAAAVMVSCSSSPENASTSANQADKAESKAEITSHMVKADESKVMWKGVMLGVKEHTGTLDVKEAKIKAQGDAVVGGSFTVDMTSMVATDDNYQPEEGKGKEQLIGHLSSADFFDVANHPTAHFKITEVDGNKAIGELTVRGKTHQETVENFSFDAENMMISGTLTFDRQKYEVSFSTGAADYVISDDIVVDVKMKVQG